MSENWQHYAHLQHIDITHGPMFTNNNMLIVREGLWNAQSLCYKDFLLKEHLEQLDLDFCAITETWLQDDKPDDLA